MARTETSSSPDQRSVEATEYRRLYSSKRWKDIRDARLDQQPLCERCLEQEIVEVATVVHHKIPHRGDMDLFWNGPFENLCAPHHNSQGQLEDHGKTVIRFDAAGWPI